MRKVPPITEKIIDEAEKTLNEKTQNENVVELIDEDNKGENKIFDEETNKEEPLILINEVSNGKANLINNNLSPAVRKIVTEKILNLRE